MVDKSWWTYDCINKTEAVHFFVLFFNNLIVFHECWIHSTKHIVIFRLHLSHSLSHTNNISENIYCIKAILKLIEKKTPCI